MNFDFTPEQSALQDMARKFSAEKLAPFAGEWDEKEQFPMDTVREAAQIGFGGIYIAESFGGVGLGRLDGAIIFEALAAGCISTTAYLTVHNMVAWMIENYAAADLKKHYLPRLCRLDSMGSYCLTEPGAGSDAASLKTKAVLQGGDYVISGSKCFITMGGVSDVYIVMARTGGDGASGVSAFLVPKDSKGLSFGKPEKKMGWRNQPTVTVNLDNVRVPKNNLLGKEGEGFKIAMRALDGGRINIAACSIGGAGAALDASLSYTHSRKQFGKRLTEFQALQFKLADMATNLEAARLMTYRAAAAFDTNDTKLSLYGAMAKQFASEAAFRIADEAVQLHGGYGYIRDYPVERILRDLRVNRILEGTNEIMRVIISRKILDEAA